MHHWNTDKIKAALAAGLPGCEIRVSGPGGDHDTSIIRLSRPNPRGKPDDPNNPEFSSCSVFGTLLGDCLTGDKNDCDVDEVFAGACDRYGMEQAIPDEHRLYADVADILIDLGYSPVSRGWKAYF